MPGTPEGPCPAQPPRAPSHQPSTAGAGRARPARPARPIARTEAARSPCPGRPCRSRREGVPGHRLGQIALDAAEDAPARDPEHSPRHRARARSAAGRGRRSGSREVAANLLAAAQLHTPRARPVHVEVAARRDQAILAVTNEGRGIDPERAPHPFEASPRDADRRSGSRAADARSSPSPIIAASIHADKSTATERSAAGDACNRHDAGQLPTRASSPLCRPSRARPADPDGPPVSPKQGRQDDR